MDSNAIIKEAEKRLAELEEQIKPLRDLEKEAEKLRTIINAAKLAPLKIREPSTVNPPVYVPVPYPVPTATPYLLPKDPQIWVEKIICGDIASGTITISNQRDASFPSAIFSLSC